jgi:prepilin-type N-terminal cleavage/methylation domain-containing protein
MKTKRNAGLTLVEVLIASSILVIIVMIAMGALLSSTTAATKGEVASDVEQRARRLFGVLRDDMSIAQYNGSANTTPSGTAPVLPVQMGYFGATSYNCAIGYRIPGVRDPLGSTTTVPSGNMVYGYNSPLPYQLPPAPNMTGFFQDLVCVIRFEADTVLKESVSSPDATQFTDWGTPFPPFPLLTPPTPSQILNLDVNNDGDQSDTFVTGKIVKYIVTSSTNTTLKAANVSPPYGIPALLSREVLSDSALFRVGGSAPGQFNADVEGHPSTPSYSGVLFGFVDQSGVYTGTLTGLPITNALVQTAGKGLLVSVWHGSPDSTGKGWILRTNKLLIRFRIPQS